MTNSLKMMTIEVEIEIKRTVISTSRVQVQFKFLV